MFTVLVGSVFGQIMSTNEMIKLSLLSNWNNNPYYKYGHHIGSLRLQNYSWQAVLEPVIIDSIVSKQVLGSEFSRFGISARFEKAYIKYSNNNYYFLLGRRPLKRGQIKHLSIIQILYVGYYK